MEIASPAFASGLVSSSTLIRLLFLSKTKFPVGHGSCHAILQWKKVMGCVPLAAPGENQHGLNGCSPQCPSRMSFSLVQTLQASEFLPKVGLVQKSSWRRSSHGQEEITAFHLWDDPPPVTPIGVFLQASEVERQLSLQVHTLREDFREKNSSSSQHIVRLESLQAEVSHVGWASLLQKVARAVLTRIMNPSELGKQNLLLGANKEKDGSGGAKDSPTEDFCCNPRLAGVARVSFHHCLSHKHACKMNG